MAINIKWTGIEQYKYGLTARWYVSAYYGNDIDVDVVGLYNPSTNPTGHGGPTRPFASLSKVYQAGWGITIVDSGYYTAKLPTTGNILNWGLIGDGYVVCAITGTGGGQFGALGPICNLVLLNSAIKAGAGTRLQDVKAYYSTVPSLGVFSNVNFVECNIVTPGGGDSVVSNSNFVGCSGSLILSSPTFSNSVFMRCENLTLSIVKPRPSGKFIDYSILVGSVKTSVSINGKAIGVTVEDFKADGNYFVKSYSEVDLFGNPSGSGASVAQLQTLFNNYFSPIYIDTWQDADFSLKPTASDFIKFGGLNGSYIGALPVGYRFSTSDLWNTYKDAVNTSNIDYDMINAGLVITDGQDVGTYRSTRISLPKPITCDLAAFFANLVYNVEGTARQGVANQRIDTTPDLLPDNTVKQRVVYDYKLSYAPNNTDSLSAFKNFELNRTPWVDASGRSMLDELYVATERQRPVIQDFIIEFTLRKVIID